MYRKDYLQRKIDEVGKALAKLLAELRALKEKKQFEEAIELTLSGLKDEVDIDLKNLLEAPSAEVLVRLVQEKEYTNEHLKYLGDIIYEYACIITEPSERTTALQKSLALYEHIVATETETIHFEMLQRISGIRNEI